ncbi:MAG: outer membrane beta-barrel protein [Rickettsiales bacterium]|jgi:opacity protein-like surface antigen|nr:outer membrane beta-barrel protein [Rickettsiales bacterium]
MSKPKIIYKVLFFAIAFCLNIAIAKSPSEPIERKVGETWTYSGEGDDNNNRKVIDNKKEVTRLNKNSNILLYAGGKINYTTSKVVIDGVKGDNNWNDSLFDIGFGGGIKYKIEEELFVGGEGYFNYALTNYEGKRYYTKEYGNGNYIKQTNTDKLEYGLSVEINAIIGYNITEQFNIYGLVGIVGSKPKFKSKWYAEERYSGQDYTWIGEEESYETEFNISPQFGIGIGFNLMDNIDAKLQYTLSNPNYKLVNHNDVGIKVKNSNISLITNLMF